MKTKGRWVQVAVRALADGTMLEVAVRECDEAAAREAFARDPNAALGCPTRVWLWVADPERVA